MNSPQDPITASRLKAAFRRDLLKVAAVLLVCGLVSACASKQGASQTPQQAEQSRSNLPLPLKVTTSISSFFSKLFPKKEEPPKALEPHLLGKIKQVNQENGFVLLDASNSSSAAEGDELLCVSDQTQTAVLKMTALRSASFLIADIVSGKPEAGDRVYRR